MSAARLLRWTVAVGLPAVVALLAYRHRAVLGEAAGLLGHARWAWLMPGLGAIAGVYLCRAFVYGLPLRLLRYALPRTFLWKAALIATTVHQLAPAAGASGYAFLTYALAQRGVPAGEASMVALVDTLSYATAVGTLFLGGLGYFLATGAIGSPLTARALAPGLIGLAGAAVVYYLQRDESRLVAVLIGVQRWLASWVHPRWREAPVRAFVADYFASKRIIGRQPSVFVRMVGWQYVAVCCDTAALYTAFLALGSAPGIGVVFMGFVMAMAVGAVAAAPGGGGSFEVVMTTFFAAHGIAGARGLGATILYRVIAFWIPVAVTLVLLLELRRRRPGIRT